MIKKPDFEAFDENIVLRVQKSTKAQLQQIVDTHEEIINISHAARIAVLHYLKENLISKRVK